MILRDSFIINGSLSVLGVNTAVSSNLTALFYNNANGNVEKRTIGDIINYNASNFLSGFTISVPNIFTTNVSNVTPQNNQLSLLLASQSAGTVFAAHPNFNGQPTFQKLTAEHLSDANVMFTSHPANTITSGNIDYWNSLSGVTNSLSNFLPLSGGTMTGKLITSTPTASGAGLLLPHGVAPTSPNNGDIWTTTAGTYIRINGTTRQLAHTSSWSLITEAEILSGTATTSRFISAQRLKYAFNNLVAARASRLESGATINGVLFDGSQPITISASPLAHTHPISDIINLQTILDNKQPLNSNLTSISTLSSGSGFLKRNANNTWTLDNSTYLTSETDPYGVSSFTISGTQNKVFAIRLRNNTIVSATIDALTEAELNGTPTDNAKLISSLVLKNYIDNRLSSTMTYKGQVTTYSQLPTTGQKIGDVYNIVNANTSPEIKAGDNVAWNGTSWDVLAGFVDVSNLLTNSQLLKLSGDVTANGNLSGTVGVTINNNAVTSGKIANGAVTSGKLATILTTTGTFNNVVVNSKGLVTSGSNIAYLTQNDLPTTLPNPNSLILKFNGGSSENNNLYTYTGANAKTINFVAGANTTISTANSTITISSTNTTYSSGTLQELITGTDLTNKVWSANVLSDFLIAQVTSNDTLEYNQQTGGIQTRDWVSNAYSQFAMAIGNYTTVQGQGSTAIGNVVSTYGASSHNIGSFSNVNAPMSINLGSYNGVNAYKGGAFGLGLDVTQQGMFAVGRYNEIEDIVQPYITIKPDKQKVFVIGTGLDENSRKNAVEVFQDDTTHFRGIPKYSDYLTLATISGMIETDDRALVNRQFVIDYVNDNSGANLPNGTYADITGSNTTNKLWSGSVLKSWGDNKLLYLSGGILTGLLTTQNIRPSSNNVYNIGTSSLKYANVYATNFVGNASTASAWATARTFTVSGNGLTTASVSVNGSGNVNFSTGLASIGTAGTYTKVTTDIYGRVTSGSSLSSNDITVALGYLPSSANTTYTAGAGLSLSGTSFHLPVTTVGTGSFVKSVVQSAVGLTVTMDNPVGTTYSAGNGLSLSGTSFHLPVTVTGTGSFVKSVTQTASGITVTMSTPPDNNTTYTAGNGLTLASNQFSLPVTVSGSGSFVQSVTQTTSGITVTLGTPPNTSYASGSLALLTGGTDASDRVWKAKDLNDWINTKGYSTVTTSLRADSSSYINGNITLSSGSNTTIEQVGSTFVFGSTDTTYTAGNGLSLTGTEFTLPITVSGTGTYVRSVTQTASGLTVTLGTPPNTSYSAGTLALLTGGTDTTNRVWSSKILNDWLSSYNYLTSGDISSFTSTKLRANTNTLIQGDITLSSSGSTNLSQVGNTIVISSTDTNTTYSAGNGLTLSGTQFSLPVTVSGTGTYVQSVTQTASGLTVTLGTPPNTSYSAGNGLTLSGTQFSLPVTVSGSGSYVQSVTQTASGLTVTLGTPPNTNTTYTAGNGLTLSGTQFSLPVTTSGTGNVVDSVVSSANGISVTKNTTAMTTSHPANAITSANISNWNSAYGWGNHSGLYVDLTSDQNINGVKNFIGGSTYFKKNNATNSGEVEITSDTNELEIWVRSNSTTNPTHSVLSVYDGGTWLSFNQNATETISFSSKKLNNQTSFNLYGANGIEYAKFVGTDSSNALQLPRTNSVLAIGYFSSNTLFNTNNTKLGINGGGFFNGVVSSTGFIKQGQTDASVLLAGGGHKPLSEFATVSGFVPYTGATQDVDLEDKLIITRTTDSDAYFKVLKFGIFAEDPTALGMQVETATPLTGFYNSPYIFDISGSLSRGSDSVTFNAPNEGGLAFRHRNDYFDQLKYQNGRLTLGERWDYVNSTHKLRVKGNGIFTSTLESSGYKKTGFNDTYVLLAGGGHKLLSEIGSTRLRSNANAYLSGDITLTAGSNVTLSQSGNVITVNATNTNTTYTAGNGLTLSGTQFSLPVTVSGTGTYVQSVTQTTNGLTVTLGTPPNTNTTYSAANLSELSSTTNTTARLITGQVLNQWATNKGFVTANDIPYLESHEVFVSSSNLVSGSFTTTTPTAIHNSSVMVFLNGVKLPKSKITISGNTITITNTGLLTPIIVGDFIDVQYLTK